MSLPSQIGRPHLDPQINAALSELPCGYAIFDHHLQLLEWTQNLTDLLRLPPEALRAGVRCADLLRQSARFSVFMQEGRQNPFRALTEQAERGQSYAFEATLADGHVFDIRSTQLDGGGLIISWFDLTTRRAGIALGQLTLRVFTQAPDGIIFTDGSHHILAANPASGQITGFDPDELPGRVIFELIAPANLETTRRLAALLEKKGSWSGEFELHRKNGESLPVSLRVSRIDDSLTDRPTHYLWLITDISERRHAEALIRHAAQYDALTALPNRGTLVTHLAESLPGARRHHQHLAVLLIDLDHFKLINDTLGHRIGDGVLLHVAQRLAKLLRESDYVARFGGDEFVVILPAINSPADAATVANKIVSALAAPIEVAEHELHTSPSIGITLFPDDGDDGDTLLKNADTAMYHAKAAGRNNFQFFASEMNRATTERLDLERKLRHALARGELTLHYQPQFDAGSRRPVGVETLLRWNHPNDGMIAPCRFIPIAEQNGMIVDIGEWVLHSACRQMKRWLDDGLAPLRVAVNVSARQLRQRDFCEMVAGALADSGLPPELLEIEITESSVMENPQETIGILQKLSSMGITLAIDDFGTGYSSLAYLKLFPIDHLKIDRSFVADIEHDLNDRTIAFGTIALAHSLGLKVVAEGVETEDQYVLLRGNGCDEIQGYLFSLPLPADAAFAFLRARCPAR
ncbi:MAG: EAL domain-containing protein [Azonexus sp.]|nr:EAL domain-containing protein [Azonexus sp.]